MNVLHTAIESHSSIEIGKIDHQALWMTYQKVSIAHSHTPKELWLAISVNATNDTLNPVELVPYAELVKKFLQIIALGTGSPPRHDFAEWAKVADTTRAEVSFVMANNRLCRALTHDETRAASKDYKPRDIVLYWRKTLLLIVSENVYAPTLYKVSTTRRNWHQLHYQMAQTVLLNLLN